MAEITVTKELIGYEDISFASGGQTPTDTFSRTTSTGGSQSVHKLSDKAIPIEDDNSNFTGTDLATVLDELHDNLYAPSGTKMLFMQASAPTGWTIDTSFQDGAIVTISDSGVSNGGAAKIENGLAHTHSFSDSFSGTTGNDSHNHRWYSYQGDNADDHVYNSDGDAVDIDNQMDGSPDKDPSYWYIPIDQGNSPSDCLETSYTNNDTHNHSFSDSVSGTTGSDGASTPYWQEAICASKD